MKKTIGFVGQGWIGKNYADDFERRGYSVVRYALEPEYAHNKDAIASCDIVFIAVPTPTTPDGFDPSIVEQTLNLIGQGKIAVIKSTLEPGTTIRLQTAFPNIFVVHSPEFLVEKTAAHDAANPKRNIIGIPADSPAFQAVAEQVQAVLPKAPYEAIMPATEAELVKYAGNCFLYTKVVFMNLLYDLVASTGADWETVRTAMLHDERIGGTHTQPVIDGGRGAGGHCFIKDFETFRRFYAENCGDENATAVLSALVAKNNELLRGSGKDLDLLTGVYGAQ